MLWPEWMAEMEGKVIRDEEIIELRCITKPLKSA